MKNLISICLLCFMLVSCTSVDPGHKGVEVSWGGETNLTKVYPEGLHGGLHWLVDDMIEYDVREHTIVQTFEFNDMNDMITTVVIALDYNLNPAKVAYLHVGINDVNTKIITSLSSAAKEVVPQYSAVDLNKHKRAEGEAKLTSILTKELPEFFVEFKRVRFTDIGIPPGVSKLAEETAVQIGKNELASKKEAEQVALAAANVAASKGSYEAAQYDVQTKALMSTPAVLSLYRAETERIWAEKGVSPYGSNNVFGSASNMMFSRNLKNE